MDKDKLAIAIVVCTVVLFILLLANEANELANIIAGVNLWQGVH